MAYRSPTRKLCPPTPRNTADPARLAKAPSPAAADFNLLNMFFPQRISCAADWQLGLRQSRTRRATFGLSFGPTYSNDAVKRLVARERASCLRPASPFGARLGARISRQWG